MMRTGAMIVSVLVLGAAAVTLPAAPQDKPASEPPKANAGQSAVSPGNTAAQDAPQRDADEPRHLQRTPRVRERIVPDDPTTAAIEDAIPERSEFRRGGEHGFGRGPREFSRDQIERVMQVVRDLDPDRASRLEELRKSDPDRFAIGLARAGRHLLGLSLLKDRDPQLYELKLAELRLSQQINRIAQEILAARETCSEGELERLESMLRDRLREQHELNYRARAREIIMLEKHVTSMRENLVEDIKHSEERIEARMAELLHEPDGDDHEADAVAADRPQR